MMSKVENFHVEVAARKAVKEVVKTFTDKLESQENRTADMETKIRAF